MRVILDDTIVAPATAPGSAAIAVIRLSGPKAFEITSKIFRHHSGREFIPSKVKSHTVYFGLITDKDVIVDEVVVTVFKGPHSYTSEDTIEISCHGSTFIQNEIMRLCTREGARPARPGEFTQRAFLNGRMDLSQAEAVADLIASDTAGSHRLAMSQMRGGFSGEIKKLREELIHFSSLIELELDFAEEDVEFANRKDLMSSIRRLQDTIGRLRDSFALGNVIRTGVPVVIAGKPNAGKSTLLNALLNEERAIVSEIEGTTRDTVEEEITLGGIKFRFVDTAGIRETKDAIEKLGVERTFEKIGTSTALIYMFDVTKATVAELEEELRAVKRFTGSHVHLVVVGNKSDLVQGAAKKFDAFPDIIYISAKNRTNIDHIEAKLLSLVDAGRLNTDSTIIANARHADALEKTSAALDAVYRGIELGVTNDFIAADLRLALYHLGEITGDISTDDLLENIFRRFCIGK